MRVFKWISLTKSAEKTCHIFKFGILTTVPARRRKSFIPCLYMKTIRVDNVRGCSTHFLQLNVTNTLQNTRCFLYWRFCCSSLRSILNCLINTSKISLICSSAAPFDQGSSHNASQDFNVTELITNLFSSYDKRLRPNFGGKRTTICRM